MEGNTSISFLLRALVIAFRNRVNQRSRCLSLTSTQMEVLLYLKTRKEEHVSLKEISNFMMLSHPTVIEVIRRLEQKGYVENVPDEQDRRCRNIRLTKKSMGLCKEMNLYRKEMDDLLLNGLGNNEIEELQTLLLRMLGNLTNSDSI